MRDWDAERIAAAAGADLVAPPPAGVGGPARAVVDSRAAGAGDLFVGIPGANVDGGRFAAQALAGGAWGVLARREHAEAARGAAPGALLAAEDPAAALQRLATAWRRELGCSVIAVTGSTGKTSTKDILAAMLRPHRRTAAGRENLNTEIGLPLAVLEAERGTEALVLEMAMRGPGQIAQLAAIAAPDVGVVVNVGPVHLELLGSIEAVAAAKGELLDALPDGGTAVVPAGEARLERHLRPGLEVLTFGDGGDVALTAVEHRGEGAAREAALVIDACGERIELDLPLAQAHHRTNALAAVAAARAIGVRPGGRVEVALSGLRGERIALPGGVVVIDDCYNANPMSMRAALEDLAASAPGRRVAVLGDMLELGADERRFHEEAGAQAAAAGVDLLVTVGPRAAAMAAAFGGEVHAVADAAQAAALLPGLLAPGDTVLVKGSRGVGLEVVARALATERGGG